MDLLSRLQRQLAPLADNLSDSLALSGSEAYQAALIFYRNVKMAARAGVPNAKTIEADLSNRFPAAAPGQAPAPNRQAWLQRGRGTLCPLQQGALPPPPPLQHPPLLRQYPTHFITALGVFKTQLAE